MTVLMTDYRFTRQMFYRDASWRRLLATRIGRPGLRYLEVGVFEGSSFTWMLDNVLTAPDAQATAVDIFYADAIPYEATFRANVARSPGAAKATILKGDSALVLRTLPLGAFDIIYIDGGHGQRPLFLDLANAWMLLAPNGMLILDDYGLGPNLPDELRPKPIIDAFMSAVAFESDVMHREWQVFLQRTPPRHLNATAPDPHPYYDSDVATELGRWRYYWNTQSLATQDTEVVISGRRKTWFERALRSPRGRTFVTTVLARCPAPLTRTLAMPVPTFMKRLTPTD